MLEQETASHEQKNLETLLQWSAGSASAGLIEHIQILSELLHALPSLIEPGGRLYVLMEDFGRWALEVQEVRSSRQDPNRPGESLRSIEGLGDSWKAENAALLRKLTAYARELGKVDQPAAGTSIASIVETCAALLEGVLDELHVTKTIEESVVGEEKQWIEDRLNAIAEDMVVHMPNDGADAALWRS